MESSEDVAAALGTSPASFCPRAYSASSSGSCSFCALVRAPTRLALGARVGVTGSEETTPGRFGSVVIVWGVLSAGMLAWRVLAARGCLGLGLLLNLRLLVDLLFNLDLPFRHALPQGWRIDFQCWHRGRGLIRLLT
jgi:hypothetical protein